MTTRSSLPWVLRIASAGAAWVRALRALPRDDQATVIAEMGRLLEPETTGAGREEP